MINVSRFGTTRGGGGREADLIDERMFFHCQPILFFSTWYYDAIFFST